MDRIPFEQTCRFLRLQKQLGDQYGEYIARAGRRVGLSRPEADVMLFLANNPQFHTARDVVNYRALSKTYVSKAVEQLVERGFLQAVTCETDRRLQELRLLPTTLGPLRVLRQAQADFFERLSGGLSAEDEAALNRLMERVQDNLDRMR